MPLLVGHPLISADAGAAHITATTAMSVVSPANRLTDALSVRFISPSLPIVWGEPHRPVPSEAAQRAAHGEAVGLVGRHPPSPRPGLSAGALSSPSRQGTTPNCGISCRSFGLSVGEARWAG